MSSSSSCRQSHVKISQASETGLHVPLYLFLLYFVIVSVSHLLGIYRKERNTINVICHFQSICSVGDVDSV